MIRCDGPCGRLLEASAFRRNGRYRRQPCRDCTAHPGWSAGARYEEILARYRGREVAWDDPGFRAAREAVRDAVVAHGPIRVGGVQLGWDVDRDEVARSRG